MFVTFLQVAAGGAIGAVLRFGLGVAVLRAHAGTFPVAVLIANVVGSFLMGLFVVYAGQRGLAAWQPFVMTGVLGGFTTFSAFSLEAWTLFERGDTGAAALYVALSVLGALAGLALGVSVMRGMLA
ncbi:MAG: CrcB family protein [Pseudomonadota bacterium]